LDIDGDGFDDAVGAFWQKAGEFGVFAYRNDGAGRMTDFDAQTFLASGDYSYFLPVRAADFTGDGLDDYVVGAVDRLYPFVSNGLAAPTALPFIQTSGIGL